MSVKGFATTDEKTGTTISQNPIHRITAWYPDELDAEVFAVIVKGEGGYTGKEGEFHCIVVKCQQAFSVLSALKKLMSAMMMQQQKAQLSASTPPVPAKVSSSSLAHGTWDCLECTFVNHELINQCEMCSSQRCSQTSGSVDDEFNDYAVCIQHAPSRGKKKRKMRKEREGEG